MIAFSYITKTLDELDRLYINASSKKKAIYYSKLATIELCGWVEETVDNIVQMHANRKLKNRSNKKYVEDKIIKPIYGFQYNQHIRPMLIAVVGIITIERIETKLERGGKITLLKQHLGNLKQSRNSAAHTHITGTPNAYDAPSVIKSQFNIIKSVLKEIDNELRAIIQ